MWQKDEYEFLDKKLTAIVVEGNKNLTQNHNVNITLKL